MTSRVERTAFSAIILAGGLAVGSGIAAAGSGEPHSAEAAVSAAERLREDGTEEGLRGAADRYRDAGDLFRDLGNVAGEASTREELGEVLYALGDLRGAASAFETAASRWEVVGDRPAVARTLTQHGTLLNALGENLQAREILSRALGLHEELKDDLGQAEALNNLAYVHFSLGESDQALALYRRALALREAAREDALAAQTLNYMAMVYSATGEHRQALAQYTRCLELFRRTGDRFWEAATLHNVGRSRLDLGETEKALEAVDQALVIVEEIRDRRSRAFALHTRAMALAVQGHNDAAFEALRRALALIREVGDPYGEAQFLSSLGKRYAALGEWGSAEEHYQRSLALLRQQGDRGGEAVVLQNLGLAQRTLGRTAEAQTTLGRALELTRASSDRDGEAYVLSALGDLSRETGALEPAGAQLREAAALHATAGNRRGEAAALERLGAVLAAGGDEAGALEAWQRALALYREATDREGQAQALYRLAGAEARRGRLEEARRRIEASLSLVESVRQAVSGGDLRASYLASRRDLYELHVEILMRLHAEDTAGGHAAAALEAAERARARSLLEGLGDAEASLRRAGDSRLRERVAALRSRLNEREDYRLRLLRARRPTEDVRAVEEEITRLLSEFRETQRQMRAAVPRHAALTEPAPATLAEIRQALDGDTVLLEYALGEERSFLFWVTPSQLEAFPLPPRDSIEGAARRLHGLLSARDTRIRFETPEERRRRVSTADADARAAARALSDALLSPVATRLASVRRLAIAGEGSLLLVPFATLPGPGSADRPLITDHEILGVPSAAVLVALRRAGRPRPQTEKVLAVVADPVFEADDPRIPRPHRGRVADAGDGPAARGPIDRALDAFGGSGIPRLVHSRAEARAVLGLVPRDRSWAALDFDANREAVLGPELGRYRIVHFATHGVVDAQRPELSGLVLSLYDRQGRRQEGFLRLHDVYDLELGAELVVLSACRTALGREVRGEGLVGLTRGFLYAGAQRVLATLWSVPDRATAELMKRFYRALLVEGLPAPAALRAAQLALAGDPRWREPYYWAGVTLQGDWK